MNDSLNVEINRALDMLSEKEVECYYVITME